MSELILIGIDVGGTFTDFVIWRNGSLRIHKVLTTPADQSEGIVEGLRELGLLGEGRGAGGDFQTESIDVCRPSPLAPRHP